MRVLNGSVTTAELTARLRVLLPETYQVFDPAVEPRPMGSAGLKLGPDGEVLWGEMWASFCHLAMAGGPPHRGRLLEPLAMTEEEANSAATRAVSAEIARGIRLVTGLCAEPSPRPGWLSLYCTSAAMSSWLERAIVMENVSALARGLSLYLPLGPGFRVEKEIKNVITSVAKTCHYWQDHMSDAQHDKVATLLARMQRESPLIPIELTRSYISASGATEVLARTIYEETGFEVDTTSYPRWVGVRCGDVPTAVWMMRALAACNLLARREECTVFMPSNQSMDAEGERTLRGLREAFRLAGEFGMVRQPELPAVPPLG